jgi:flagellar protein FliO/FliZ
MRPRIATSLVALVVTSLAHAATEGDVIFPGKAATSASPAAGGLSSFTLIVGAIMAGVGLWLFWRGRRTAMATEARALAIEETRSLGNRQYLVVASYRGQKFLLGVCPGRIDHLAALPGEKPTA